MKHFNIRVYGIWINEERKVLVSDERINNFEFTKFPGGGLEFGEGIIDCLLREWKEELNVDINILQHIYTTDFFQVSAFDEEAQIISIYYLVEPIETTSFEVKEKILDFHYEGREEQSLRWISLTNFSEHEVTLPIDKHVAKLLKYQDFWTNE